MRAPRCGVRAHGDHGFLSLPAATLKIVPALRIGAGLSTDIDAARATAEATAEALGSLGNDAPDLIVCFFANDHRDAAEDIAAALRERCATAIIIGCAAEGIIGGARELEVGPAVSVWAGVLPETRIRPFVLEFQELDGEARYEGWPDELADDSTMLLLCDSFSFPTAHLLMHTNADYPALRVIGGVASGVHAEGEARLICDDRILDHGAVGVTIDGRVRVESLVSQGCRPIGEPAVITRADRNMIFELAGCRPIDRVRDIWSAASPHERALMQGGLFLGRVVDEYKETDFERGDFVIRTVVGADPETGVVAVGDVVNVGETVQFHVRDPQAADDDLRARLGRVSSAPAGALLFACNGRGSNMFDVPDHDAAVVSKELGTPLAGFFANGELGPVSGKNFWHSFTASLALFVDSRGPAD
jgi:small ligand-binding sensory domain FIST